MTYPIHSSNMRLSRTVSFSLTLIAVLMAAPALAEEVSPPVPPVVDIPPPPPLPATIDVSEPRYVVARPVYAEPAPIAAQPASQYQYQYEYGDPYGFTSWLNGVRAQSGRGPVGHDANLSAWASANNGQQLARGMGHHVMGAARRQNSGMGAAGTVWQMWMASPAHQAALLDPTITMIGIAASGSYWTFNAY